MYALIIQFRRLIAASLAAIMGITCFSGAAILGAAFVSTAPDAEAQRRASRTVTRTGPAGGSVSRSTTVRHAAPAYRGPATVHGTARRTTRRTTRRVARRHFYALPAGYRVITRGSYRYYYYSGIYYYPYYISGRTVYVEVDIDANGNPGAPPPASEININVNVN